MRRPTTSECLYLGGGIAAALIALGIRPLDLVVMLVAGMALSYSLTALHYGERLQREKKMTKALHDQLIDMGFKPEPRPKKGNP